MAYAHCMLDTLGYKQTLIICNNFLLFHGSNSCTKAPKCYIASSLPLFSFSWKLIGLSCLLQFRHNSLNEKVKYLNCCFITLKNNKPLKIIFSIKAFVVRKANNLFLRINQVVYDCLLVKFNNKLNKSHASRFVALHQG